MWKEKSIFHLNNFSITSKVVLFLLLCIGTVCSIFFVDRYQDVGRQLLLNADFAEGLNHWHSGSLDSGQIIVHNNRLVLTSHDTEKSILVFQKIQTGANGKKIRLCATLAAKDVVAGEQEWHKARLLLVQYLNKTAQWRLPHSLAALEGTHDWQRLCEVFSTSSECSEMRVMVQMSHCSGEFFVQDLSLYEVEETNLYGWVKLSIKAVWILFVFVLFVPSLKRSGSTLLKTFIVLTVSGVVIGTTLPGNVKNELQESITEELVHTVPVKSTSEELVNRAPGKSISEELVDPVQRHNKLFPLAITKVAHFCLFALLALLLMLKNPSRPLRLVLLDLFMFACATELMQFYVDERLPLASDLFIDMVGSGVGLLFGRLLSMRLPGGKI